MDKQELVLFGYKLLYVVASRLRRITVICIFHGGYGLNSKPVTKSNGFQIIQGSVKLFIDYF